MHLEQIQQNAEFSLQRPQNNSKNELQGLTSHCSPFCSFLHHYASVQEMTDVLTSHSLASLHQNQPEQANLVDYVDQFLWNSPSVLQSPLLADLADKTTAQVQKQNVVAQNYPLIGTSLAQQVQGIEQKSGEAEDLKHKGDLSKDYRKNLAGYIVKKVIRILLSADYAKKLRRFCTGWEVDLQMFKNYCEQSLPRLFGPNSIYELLQISCEKDRRMKQLLLHLLTKVLRKKYTLEILKEGRMRDYDAYIQVKNRGLLYFSLLLP